MESKEMAVREQAAIIEQVVIGGDLTKLSGSERVSYYRRVCDSLGLNYLTRPFDYIVLNGKLQLYARRDCTDQLRALHKISVELTPPRVIEGVYTVSARAKTTDGRADESTGAVDISNLKGEFRANAIMKAETKAKRRVTLSIVGLGWLDESETGSIPDAKVVDVDMATGEVKPEAEKAPVPRKMPDSPSPVVQVPPAQQERAVQAQLNALATLVGGGSKLHEVTQKEYDCAPTQMTRIQAAQLIAKLQEKS